MLCQKEREKIIEVALKAQGAGLVTLTGGNFSLRAHNGLICLTPSGLPYSELQKEDIVVFNSAGDMVEGSRTPSIEKHLHLEVYNRRKEIGGICHTHSPFAAAWASVEAEFPLVLAEVAIVLGGPLRKAPFQIPGTRELADIVTETLGQQNAVLMENHGLLTVGLNLEQAFAAALIVEEGAKVAYYAHTLDKVKKISPAQALAIQKWMDSIYGQQEKR